MDKDILAQCEVLLSLYLEDNQRKLQMLSLLIIIVVSTVQVYINSLSAAALGKELLFAVVSLTKLQLAKLSTPSEI